MSDNCSIPMKSRKKYTKPVDESGFNELNIYYRVCEEFVQNKEESESVCECYRPIERHKPKDKQRNNAPWDMQRNTLQKPNPPHGITKSGARFIRLALDTPEAKVERLLLDVWKIPKPRLIMSMIGGAKYFQLNNQIEENFINGIINVALKADAWIITNGYNIGVVQLVGQAINKIKITNPKRSITAIGVCKWGSVKNRYEITGYQSETDQTSSNRSHSFDDREVGTQKRLSGQRDLDMNHSHYLMLDDGRLRHYDIGDYRTRLCVQLAKLRHEVDYPVPIITVVVEGGLTTIKNIYHDLHNDVPVIIIDGSGRIADLFKKWLLYTKEFENHDKDSITKYEIGEINRIESIGTKHGGCAKPRTSCIPAEIKVDREKNVLQELFNRYSERLKADIEEILANRESSKVKKVTSASRNQKKSAEADINETLLQVMYCLQPSVRSGISMFNFNTQNDFSETIFRSICKSRQKYFERKEADENDRHEIQQRRWEPPITERENQRQSIGRRQMNTRGRTADRSKLLDLAMDWNCIDVAKELILRNSLDNILNKEQAFIEAVKKDLPAFVYEFLKLGISPSEVFAINNRHCPNKSPYCKLLEKLYGLDIVSSSRTHLRWFIETNDGSNGKEITTLSDLNAVFTRLIGNYMQKLYIDSENKENKNRSLVGWQKRSVSDSEKSALQKHSENIVEEKEITRITDDYIMRDLFLWSILMNRIELAKVLLSFAKYRICAALIATKILKQYYTKAPHGELKHAYLKNATYFEQYAIECIIQCEKNDADQACQIVLQRIELYGNVTCLQVASDARDKLFIATSCCVQAMSNVWYNKTCPKESRSWDIISFGISILSLGLLAPFLVTYRDDVQNVNEKTSPISLQSYGINYCDPSALKNEHYSRRKALSQYINKVKHFHLSLRTKFLYHLISYVLFLLFFSYFLLFDFQPPTADILSIHWTEIVTIIFVSCMLIEEIHYFFTMDNLTFLGKFHSYFRNLFKLMTLTGFVLFYIGLILRFSYAENDDRFMAARVVMAIDLEIWWLRSLSFIIVVKFLGPHLVAIGKMLKDLGFFICIIFVVMVGYGVASRSMTYYSNANQFNDTNINTEFDGRSVFRQIVYPVYYLMYGEFGNELSDLDEHPDAGWSISAHILLAMHMLLVNMLLVNLLIAMFSKRFDQVYEDTQNIWHSQKYLFTREYYTRSPFVPPFSLFYDLYFLCRMMFYAIKRVCLRRPDHHKIKVFKMIPVDDQCVRDWYEFETASTYEYAHSIAKAASTRSPHDDILLTADQRKQDIDRADDFDPSANDIQQVKADIANLIKSFEEIKNELKKPINQS